MVERKVKRTAANEKRFIESCPAIAKCGMHQY